MFNLSTQVSEAMVDVQPYRHARILVDGGFVVDKVTGLNASISSAFNQLNSRHVPVGFASWSQMVESGADPNARVLIDPVNSRSYEASCPIMNH